MFMCALRLYTATPRLGCAALVCVLGPGFRLRPATPGWVVRHGCVRLGLGCGCAPPLLAGVLGYVCVCVHAQYVPRHSWLGRSGGVVFVCALRLYPATPRWDVRRWCVCLGSGFSCAPPLLARGLVCVCGCLRAPLVPRHSWLGCAALLCLFWLGLRLRPTTPGWGVGSVFVCVRAPLVPRLSWLGCWCVRVFVCALRLYSATPCWGVRCGCVCLGSGLGCAASPG